MAPKGFKKVGLLILVHPAGTWKYFSPPRQVSKMLETRTVLNSKRDIIMLMKVLD